MSQESINEDKFLQNQQIEVEGSSFLSNVITKKEKGIKDEHNLLDIHGRRLSQFWQPGDTVISVVKKRIK